MAKKLTKAERLVGEQMLAMLEWASDRQVLRPQKELAPIRANSFPVAQPDKWHKIGSLDATKKAAELLAAGGVIEIWKETRTLPA
jgi:hypothetical protein